MVEGLLLKQIRADKTCVSNERRIAQRFEIHVWTAASVLPPAAKLSPFGYLSRVYGRALRLSLVEANVAEPGGFYTRH